MKIFDRLTAHAYATLAVSVVAMTSTACTAIREAEHGGTRPVPIGDALQQLQLDLSRVKVVVPSSLLLADPHMNLVDTNEGKQILKILADNQCYDIDPATGKSDPQLQHPDPLIPVSTGPLQVTVQGQLSEAGTLTVSVTPSAGGTVTRQAQQQVMVPITLVSLVTLPSFYVGQQTANIQYVTLVDAYKSADPHRADAEHKQIADYISGALEVGSRLTVLTNYALAQFKGNQASWCDGHEKGGSSLVGPAQPKKNATQP